MKMTLLGAGPRAPGVLGGLVEIQDRVGLTEVALHDADADRLATMAGLARHLCAGWGGRFEIRAEADPRAALEGASFVYSAIRVGQESARALDEEIPMRHGVLGQETTGPGGFAMALRTIPVMLGYAHLIEAVAPDALLVNFTNPVSIVGQALTQHSAVRTIGICDGPGQIQRSVAAFFEVPQDEVYVDYFGLNHCGWARRALLDGRDRIPEVIERYAEFRATDEAWSLFDEELIRSIGMLPMEYLYFYYYRDRAVGHIRDSGGSRARQIEAIAATMWPAIRERLDRDDPNGAVEVWWNHVRARASTYFARERGEAVPHQVAGPPAPGAGGVPEGGYGAVATRVIDAAAGGVATPIALDVPNRGAIPELLDDDVVEVTCLVDRHGVHPLAQGAMPSGPGELVRAVKRYERLTVETATSGSYRSAVDALVAHPLVGSYPLATAIVDDYLEAHEPYLSYLRRPGRAGRGGSSDRIQAAR